MFRFNALTLSALILSAGLVHAQTGPTGPVTPGPGPVNPPAGQQLTPERVDNYLRSKGATTKMNKHPNGMVVIQAQVSEAGWRFEVEIEFGADLKNYNLTCKLGSPQTQYSPAQLLALLKKNYDMATLIHFCYREADRQLCLDAPLFPTTATEAQFQQGLSHLLKVVRDTHALWDTSRWPTTSLAGPVSPANPTPAPSTNPPMNPVPAPQPATGLANTTWIGTETLENYGRLEFRFAANGTVIMIDTAGQSEGTYTVQGNHVTLTFGGCIYSGTINGQTMTGTAQQKGKSWNFTVSR